MVSEKPDKRRLTRLLRELKGAPESEQIQIHADVLGWYTESLQYCVVNRELAVSPALQKHWDRFRKCCALARAATFDGERRNALVMAVRMAAKILPERYRVDESRIVPLVRKKRGQRAAPAPPAPVPPPAPPAPVPRAAAVVQSFTYAEVAEILWYMFGDTSRYRIKTIWEWKKAGVGVVDGAGRRVLTLIGQRPVKLALRGKYLAAYLAQSRVRAEREGRAGSDRMYLTFARIEGVTALAHLVRSVI